MRPSDFLGGQYLRGEQLQGQEVPVTIASHSIDKMESDGKQKVVLHFVGKELGLVLNATNTKVIMQAYGDDFGAWVGKGLVLYTVPINFQGQMYNAIRVRIPATQAPAPTAQAADLDDEIPF